MASVNDLNFNQLSSVLQSITQQATGRSVLTPTNTSEFVSVAQMALKTGYDPLNTAISQMVGRTIFSIRPYSRKFKGLEMTTQRFVNHMRKLNIEDSEWETDQRFELQDDVSIDQQVVKKPKVLQMNYYGANVYALHKTIYKDQLDCAFTSPEEFQRFISMVMQNASDMIEQKHESVARSTLANLIGGVLSINNGPQVVHLLREYNAETGLNLTATTVKQPDNYPAFIKWVYARVGAIAEMLTERSEIYHANVEGHPIARHTPNRDLSVYMMARNNYQITAQVLADTYHDTYLKFATNELVNFWQSIQSPDSINVKPVYLNTADGTLSISENDVEQSNIFGVMMDREAAGICTVNQWSAAAPFNAAGGYTNYWWHFTDRYLNDFTENAVVLLLD